VYSIQEFEESCVLEISRKLGEMGDSTVRVFGVEIPRNFRADTIGLFLTEIAAFAGTKERELEAMRTRVDSVAQIGGVLSNAREEMHKMRQEVGIAAAAKFTVILNDHKSKLAELQGNPITPS
jgi:hypothetical protein